MALFSKKILSKSELLEQAAQARAKGKKKKAIAAYQQILTFKGDHSDIHAKLAPLLAETGQMKEAWESFQLAAAGYREKGFLDKAEAMWRQAARYTPRVLEVWEALADSKISRKQIPDARDVYLEGSRHFRKKADREKAIYLLHSAFELDRYHYKVTYELAGLFAQTGRKPKAIELLTELANRTRRKKLRRVRGKLFRLSPTPGAAFRWLRAAVAGR